jgi:uncharacterized protein (TIGR03435 family)
MSAAVLLCGLGMGLAWGQSTAAVPAEVFAYEVSSIRPTNPAGNGSYGSRWQSSKSGFKAEGILLPLLMRSAYDVLMDEQIIGLPKWADTEKYDVEAKMDAETAEALKKLPNQARWQQQKLMLQAVLAERCQLKVRKETKLLPVYDLVIAKGGLKMKESAAEGNSGTSYRTGKFTAHAMEVGGLVSSLSQNVGRLIVDKTGLGEKKFDFTLEWTPDESRGTTDAGPSIFTAFEEQLGLKLVPAKEPVETIVIDHMERPSQN